MFMSKQSNKSTRKDCSALSIQKCKGQNLNDNITSARKVCGYTQSELANLLGVSRQTVTNWERGTSVPDAVKLAQISDFLKISMQDLLGIHENLEDDASDDSDKNCKDLDANLSSLSNQQIANELTRFNTLYAAHMENRKRLFKKIMLGIVIFIIVVFLYRCFASKFYEVEKFEVAPLEAFDW